MLDVRIEDCRLKIVDGLAKSEAPRPGKDFFQFLIAPLDPALKGGVEGSRPVNSFSSEILF